MWGGEGVFGGLEQAGFGGQRPGPRPRDLAWERRRAGGAAPQWRCGRGNVPRLRRPPRRLEVRSSLSASLSCLLGAGQRHVPCKDGARDVPSQVTSASLPGPRPARSIPRPSHLTTERRCKPPA